MADARRQEGLVRGKGTKPKDTQNVADRLKYVAKPKFLNKQEEVHSSIYPVDVHTSTVDKLQR